MRRSFLLLFLPLAGAHCSVDPLELEGKACPCGDGYVCVDGACRKQASVPTDAGATDADAEPPDTGSPDTGSPDTGSPDTGPPDSATPDAEAGSDVVEGCSTPTPPKRPKMASGRRHVCA